MDKLEKADEQVWIGLAGIARGHFCACVVSRHLIHEHRGAVGSNEQWLYCNNKYKQQSGFQRGVCIVGLCGARFC